jgi:catechol 2,3-dioxygenase-like lactoylglutathione lyase family enzyme
MASPLYFRVRNIAAAHEALAARGVEFVGAPHVVHRDASMELWMAFFRDPDGNLLALMEELPPA